MSNQDRYGFIASKLVQLVASGRRRIDLTQSEVSTLLRLNPRIMEAGCEYLVKQRSGADALIAAKRGAGT